MENQERSEYPSQHENNTFVAMLSDQRTFADFITAFANVGALKPRLNFDAATPIERKFITEVLREGERDVIWKVPIEGGELFVVLLVEHQSTIDHGMPMRLLLYMNALWHAHYYKTDVELRRSKDFRVPPIVPIVIYTGEGAWTGTTQLKDLFACGAELKGLLPDFRFQVINFTGLTDEHFGAPDNLACAIFHVVWALMTGVSGDEFARIFEKLRPFWGMPGLERLGAFLYHYARAVGRCDAAEIVYDGLRPKEKGMSNPEVVRKRFWEVWAEEGRVEGLTIGKAEGEAKGEARKELENLRQQVGAIRAFFGRKGLPWDAYSADIAGLGSFHEATDFFVDLATAPDMTAFLRERFGH